MKRAFIILLLFFSFLYLFFSIKTHLFFSQDDFAVLAYFKSHSVGEMVREFFFYGDIWGFHKVLGYLNLRLLYDLFGVWDLPYILNNQFLHAGNLILLFLVISQLTEDNFKAFLFSLIFNSLYLYYFSNVHEYLATFLTLLSVYSYVKSHTRLALVCFFLALSAKEIAMSLPLLLFSITFFQRKSFQPLFSFFSLALFYFAYQLAFLVTKAPVDPDHPYATTVQISTIWHNLRFYLSTHWLLVISTSLGFVFRRRTFLFLLTALLTFFPALVLKNRQEGYYLYLPLAYLCLYLALTFPKFQLKTSIIFLTVFFFLGGRKILPPIAHRDFTNWQKYSLDQVVSSVASKLENEPSAKEIFIDKSKLERDALLMLESGTTDLFLPVSLADKYRAVKVVY